MKRALKVTALLAMGLLVASSFAAAQEVTLPKDFLFGHASISVLGRDSVDSSKLQEYRDLSRGVFGPQFSLVGSKQSVAFSLYGENIRQQDQHYFGQASFGWGGIAFDYNQTPHNMGTRGLSLMSETSTGVYSASPTLRAALGGAADGKLPTTARNFDFYTSLLAPTFNAANSIDVTALRQRGNVEFDLGGNLPFDLAVTYMRERKTGQRGLSGADILGAVAPVVEVPEPLNEVVQDFGVRTAYNFKGGNVHASFNRNLYNNRAETLVIDNPFQAADAIYKAASGQIPPLGGPASVRVVNAPDNEASTGRFGIQLKFKRQTRLTGDVGIARWTQNAAFYPYTINSAVLTSAGTPANLVSSLQQQSLNGKINTTTMNFSFSSRPVEGLGIRMYYRSYDLANKTNRYVITGDMSGSPDRSWSSVSPEDGAPYGHATANPYDSKTERFTASVSYDIKGLTLEGVGRTAKLTRTSREATSGKDNGFAFSALYHASDYVGIRGVVDYAKRTAKGETTIGFQADEAERKTTRTGIDIELTPAANFGVTFGYIRRNVDYPNRPNAIVVSGAAVPGTRVGLLEAKYDSFTTEIEFTPSARAEFSGYYTHEKDRSTNRWGRNLPTNLMTYTGSDKTNSFGANAVFHVVPEKWTFSLMARHQKVDGLMDVATDPANSFYIARAAIGGPQDITDYDDTKLTTGIAQLDYSVSKTWTLGVGYAYETYSFADAYNSGTVLMPQSILIFMKPNSGGYHASAGFATLNYRF
jgi:hypothetical protein